MKIAILTYVEKEGSKQYDAVVGHVAEALRAGGHVPSVVAVHGNLSKLIATLKRRKPALVFNLLEMFAGELKGDVEVAGVLDLLAIPYTGGGPLELALRQDKGLAKKALAFDGIRYPDFAIFTREDLETGGNLRMPLFVKPLRADASIGISAKSLVHNAGELMKRVAAIHETIHDAALAEEYIEGREFYVGIVGNREPRAFVPIEVDFSGLAPDAPRVLDGKAKWDESSAEYKGTQTRVAELPEELRARLQQVSLEAYRALHVRDYGRVDLRLTPPGDVYVIEVNANCYLERSGEFATAAAASGLDYTALINTIAKLAIDRRGRKH